MRILGIETSCDETAAAVVEDGHTLLSNVVASSMDLHVRYGGVVPEIAARSHIESIVPVIDEAVARAYNNENQKSETRNSKESTDPWVAIDGIAVTYGAGLGGSLLVGVMTARTLAIAKNKPLYGVNHVEGHVYANFLTETLLEGYTLPKTQPEFPLLALIVSGGHTQLVLFRNHFDYTLLGRTRDDAIGEAFDKVAKVLGLPYPGGPSVAGAAKLGDSHAYTLPKARLDGMDDTLEQLRKIATESSVNPLHTSYDIPHTIKNYDFSFSGLKTAVLRAAQEAIGEDFTFPSFEIARRLDEATRNNIAASFQRVAIETVVDKAVQACKEFAPKSVVIAGGVAANQELRKQLTEKLGALHQKSEILNPNEPPAPSLCFTDIKLCTDNGAMIATLGCFKMMLGAPESDPYTLSIQPNLTM